jgi:hypothetical protein
MRKDTPPPDCPKKLFNSHICPNSGLPAYLVTNHVIDNHILVLTYKCQHGHGFSTEIDLNRGENNKATC